MAAIELRVFPVGIHCAAMLGVSMLRPSFSKPWAALRMGAVMAAIGAVACTADDAPLSQVVVSFETDMAVPESIDTLTVAVQRRGETLLRKNYSVGSQGEARLPATLTIAAEGPPRVPVTVSVSGAKQGHWRTFRELTTVLPEGRSALLRMPVQWLCDGQLIADPSGGDTPLLRSTCDKGFTCRAGECDQNQIGDPDVLPAYEPAAVFGGSEDANRGACFDTLACMQTGHAVQPDIDCTIERPDAPNYNVALRVVGDGICDSTRSMCFVPLDGSSAEGYVDDTPRVRLPNAVCTKLVEGSVRAIYTSTACPMKTAATPPCGSWSSVSSEYAILPPLDQQPQTPTTATLIATLPVSTTPGAKQSVCCPLTADGDTLYTCLCDGQSRTDASLYAVSPSLPGGGVRIAKMMHAAMARYVTDFFAATSWKGVLYSPADRDIMRTALSGTEAERAFAVDVGVYDQASLLVDARGVYGLCTLTSDDMPASRQVVVVGHDGVMQALLPTGPDFAPVNQLDHDAAAVYIGRAMDTAVSATMTVRVTSVIRIPKDKSPWSVVLPERTLMTGAKPTGGYIGLQVDGPYLYAIYQNAPDADGRMQVELVRVDISRPQQMPAAVPQTLLTLPGDATSMTVSLLGVVDGIPLLVRSDLVSASGTSTANSALFSVIAVSPMGPRVIADFAGDGPSTGLARDSMQVYWINKKSGSVYAFPRAALP